VTVTTPGGVLTSNKKFRVTPQLTSFTPPREKNSKGTLDSSGHKSAAA